MIKINYDIKFQEIVKNLQRKPTLLLHSCCGPCSTSVLNRVKDFFDVTVVYYNPNIYPHEEYLKRKNEQIRLLKELNIKFLDCEYENNLFYDYIKGLENEKEGGARCSKCFNLRLEKTVQIARQNNFEFFGTTLTVSPHKNAQLINEIGAFLEKKYEIKYLYSDFKKQNGYLNSIKFSKEYNLYRQDYCGCEFSLIQKNNDSIVEKERDDKIKN